MQFESATFAAYDEPVPPGGAVPPSPYDPTDAVYAAARMLCPLGPVQRPGTRPSRPERSRPRLAPGCASSTAFDTWASCTTSAALHRWRFRGGGHLLPAGRMVGTW
jgi:hypothetical protein